MRAHVCVRAHARVCVCRCACAHVRVCMCTHARTCCMSVIVCVRACAVHSRAVRARARVCEFECVCARARLSLCGCLSLGEDRQLDGIELLIDFVERVIVLHTALSAHTRR